MSESPVSDRRIDVGCIRPLNGGSVSTAPGGVIDIRSPSVPWSYACLIPLVQNEYIDPSEVGVSVSMDVEVITGSAGVFLTDSAARGPLAPEKSVGPAPGREIVRIDGSTRAASCLCIRSGADGPAHLRIRWLETWVRRRFEVSDVLEAIMPALLKSCNAQGLELVASALSRQLSRHVTTDEIGALECKRAPIGVPFDAMWRDPLGRSIAADTDELTALLTTYDSTNMDARAGYLGRDYFTKFFRQSTVRVHHLVEQLREMEMGHGSVLEIGSLCGQFALTLQRLGYQTTAVDRYRAYGGAFEGYSAHLRSAGVIVIATDRTDEEDVISSLGRYDVVIAMAVVEHIPHTPRDFLQRLASHVRPGGLLVLDTPNIARYWNRKRLADGFSIHPAIADQFCAPVPFEGHHREYTASEMTWMLRQVGCDDIRVRLFDYNMLQFHELWLDHIEALLALTVDPTLADTVLAAGRCRG